MRKGTVKSWLNGNRRLVLAARFLIFYAIALFVAKHSSLFRTGLVPGDLPNITVAAVLILYRFFSIAVAPGLVLLWVFEKAGRDG